MSDYAVVRSSGKQHRVTSGERLWVDRLPGEIGASVDFGEVLVLGGSGAPKVGQPLVAGARVTAEIVAHARGPKVRVFKRRKRKGFHKTIGHRQALTELRVTAITGA